MLDIGKRLILALFILPLLYELNNCERKLGIGMYYMNYTAGPKYNFSVFNYKFYNVDNKIVIYVEFKLYEDTHFTADIKLDMLRANDKKMNLLNTHQDGCNLFSGVHNSRLLKIISDQIVHVTNLPLKCPLLANKLYIVNNYTLTADPLPSFIQPLHWVIQTKFKLNKKYVGYMLLQGNIYKLKEVSPKLKS
ncbi:uncharacterized protein LOC126763292 [Bactrocera neohumeralis]|uniref:uncharacterized protein LOC126763292 n=1 Tax=Bactrocera neohumeralis TaxID=98809 RepID=UPI0021654E64|nr:uncharacterized protein LOC126763292 [Bactrocera neohumeralis]